jgi:hypothetical protein
MKPIAERLLQFARQADAPRETMRVAVGAPFDLPPSEAAEVGAKSACEVYSGPLGGDSVRVYGVDKLQALSIAIADVDMFLVGLAQQGVLFWEDGQPYDPEVAAPLPADLSEAIRGAFRK